ncbi:MAG: hypothetical protein JOZ07_18455 [Solirubrobacterales bacterium]|nr:hypothetical protein [Solirubrobacterales bacterium]
MRVKIAALVVALASLLACTATAWGATPPAPSSFTLSAKGKVSQGVTVKPVMKKQRTIGLVVFKVRGHTRVGTVLLGTFSGHPSIHWNLKVNGTTLASGAYEIDLRVFVGGKPSSIPGPKPSDIVISGQSIRVT